MTIFQQLDLATSGTAYCTSAIASGKCERWERKEYTAVLRDHLFQAALMRALIKDASKYGIKP